MEALMNVIAIPLNALMSFCCNIIDNYAIAIVVFTLLTKVILFPVSMWVQKNGIAMVKMTPEINRLKVKYYGDKDTIADETQMLYKREKYNPLASTIPMIVQLAMLMGVIGAVKQVMGSADTVLNVLPSEAGGLTLLMPIAAGIAALALGFAQNKINPLQREQGKSEQWMTNGFSIAISLVLGAFVPLGVGIYWICSNLFSIAQQILLNQVIKPEKYIDYEDLARSKEELKAIDGLAANISKEDKKREKADYKRFFSVANKHLVFYSEKSGFYKYFQDVIEYLLKNSNIVIHYVTSDPKDQIFAIAEKVNQIKPYYIGEKRLITLMMKMDADMVVMTCPDLDNFHIKRSYVRKDIEYIYMCHGIGSHNMMLRTGALAHFDTIFCTGETQVQELRREEEVYGLKPRKLVEVGYSLIEHVMAKYEALSCEKNEKPQILIAPSWQEDNIMDGPIDAMLDSLMDGTMKIVVRPHPEYCKRYPWKINAFKAKHEQRFGNDFELQLDFSSNETVFTSDLLITDWSTISYEYAYATKRPVLFIDTPMKVLNPEYEKIGVVPLEISCRNEMGKALALNELNNTGDAVRALLKNTDTYRDNINELIPRTMFNVGTSSKVGGEYILRTLVDKQMRKKNKA